jgi:zinc protease
LPKALAGDRRNPVARTAATEGPEVGAVASPSVQRMASPLPVPQLWIGWTLPGLWGADGAHEALLARWLQQDLDLDYLRQEDPHIRHVRAALIPGLKATALMVRVLVGDGADPERIAQIVAGRVESLWTREPGQHAVLNRLKSLFDAELVLNEPPQFERALAQAELIAFGPRPIPYAEQVAKVRAVQPADLAKFAYKHLAQKRHHAVFYTPGEVAEAARPPSHADAEPGRGDSLFADAAGWDDLELPEVPAPVSNVMVRQLPTGLTVIVAKRAAASATAWLAFRGGYMDSDPPLLLELALRTRPDATDTAKRGALSDRGATRDASIEILEFRPVDIVPALDLLFKKATAPVQKWPTRDELDRMLAYVNADVDGASEQAAQAFGRALFGDHPLARLVSKGDLGRITRSDVDSWVGRVHNLRNAALVVVGDVRPEEVFRIASDLSVKKGAPSWIDAIPAMAPLPLKPARGEHVAAVVTARPGAFTDVRIGCALPPMGPRDRMAYEMLKLAIQERLSTALRFERGQGYGVNVGLEVVRGGIASLNVSTYVNANGLADALSTLRTHWQRWGQAGFDEGEVKVARWLFAGQLALTPSNGNGIAYRLFSDWNQDAAGMVSSSAMNTFRGDTSAIDSKRLNELFASCRANAVLGLTGHEPTIRQALRRAWPQAN